MLADPYLKSDIRRELHRTFLKNKKIERGYLCYENNTTRLEVFTRISIFNDICTIAINQILTTVFDMPTIKHLTLEHNSTVHFHQRFPNDTSTSGLTNYDKESNYSYNAPECPYITLTSEYRVLKSETNHMIF